MACIVSNLARRTISTLNNPSASTQVFSNFLGGNDCSGLLLHKTVEGRVMLALLAIGTMTELILTIFRVRDDLFVEEEACGFGEFIPLTITDELKLSDSVSYFFGL
ncbi:unnamed protein product [Malus baccata var. baccata]